MRGEHPAQHGPRPRALRQLPRVRADSRLDKRPAPEDLSRTNLHDPPQQTPLSFRACPRSFPAVTDVAQFNKQYGGLTEKRTDKFHDRYLIIDNATLIHVGASLNHLGRRCFAFSTLAADFIPDIRTRVP